MIKKLEKIDFVKEIGRREDGSMEYQFIPIEAEKAVHQLVDKINEVIDKIQRPESPTNLRIKD